MAGTVSTWTAAVSGNFATAANWTPNTAPNSTTSEADLLVATKAYTVTSSAAATVDYLTIGTSKATLAITNASVFTVDSTLAPYSNANNLGTIDIGAGSTMVYGAPDSPGNFSAEIFNDGGVNLTGSKTAAATLEIGAPWFELNGTGSVVLSAEAVIKADLTGANGASSTLDNETNTISGSGTIGNGSGSVPAGEGLVLQNDQQATINANAAAALNLNTGANVILNAGLIETTGAGGLTIDSFMSQQGVLDATGKGALTIKGAEVQGGGTANVASGGSIVLNNGILDLGGAVTIAKGGALRTTAANTAPVLTDNSFAGDVLTDGDIENAGTITVVNNSILNLNASIYNSGVVSLAGSTKPTEIEIFGNGAAFYGTGSLVLSNSADNSIVSNLTSQQLTNHSTISGAGTIGDDWLRLVNETDGTINANDSVGLTIVGVSQGTEGANYNIGLVETTGAGGLTITGGFGNGGDLDAVGAGSLTLNNVTLTNGGVLQTTAAGASIVLDNTNSVDNQITIVKGSTLSTTAGDTDTLANMFNHGTISVADGSTLLGQNNWLNTGVIDLNGATGETSLEVDGNMSLTGRGSVVLNNLTNASFNAITGDPSVGGGSFFTNVNNTIKGAGVIGDANGSTDLNLTNSRKGIIDATGGAGAALTINTGAQQIENNGTLETTGAGGLMIDGAGDSSQNGGTMQQNGALIADGAGALTLDNVYAQGSGSAAAAVSGASIVLNDSTLNLQGVVSTVAGSSIVAEGTTDELDSGELDNAGAIAVGSGVTLNMSGSVNNTGTITLSGASSVGGAALLGIGGGGLTLSGSGGLLLGNNSDGAIVGESAMFGARFENASTISGAGVIGSASGDQLQFINLSGGVVDADGTATVVKKKVTAPATSMTIYGNTGGPENVNAGLIETTTAGGLTIFGALENSGSLDAAGKGALVLNGVTIFDGDGVIQTTAAGASIVLDNAAIATGSVTIVTGSTLSTTAGDNDTLQAVVTNLGTINVADGSTLVAGGNWTNSGAINLNGASASTTLQINANLTLSGGGTVDLLNTNGLWDSIVSDPGSSTPMNFLTNVNDTIEGAGTIGDGNATTTFNLTNAVNGTIDATAGAGAPLTLNTGLNAINNAGVIETTGAGGLNIESWVNLTGELIADGPGALTISATAFVQDGQNVMPSGGGTIVQGSGSVEAAVSGAAIVLSNSTVSLNGTLSTVVGSSISAAAGTTDEIDDSADVENAGAININDTATLFLNAWINNSGSVNLGDAGGNGSATLELDSWGAQIFGTGSLILGDNAGNLIESQGGLTQVNFFNSGLIEGAGTIGDADLAFQNLSGGTVNANDSVALTIIGSTPVSNGLSADYNAGLIETTGRGGLTIEGTPVNGQADFINAGVIDASGKSGSGALTLIAITDTTGGGTLETTAFGTIILEDNTVISTGAVSISVDGALSTSSGDTKDALEVTTTNQGTINVVGGSTLIVDAHWQNSGAVDVNGATNAATIRIAGGSVWELLGDGTLSLNGTASILSAGAGTVLENVGNTINGQGVIGDANMTIENRSGATIDATTGGLTIDAAQNGSNIFNSGTIQSDSAGGITIEGAMQNFGQLIANLGTIDVQDADFGNGVAKINGNASIEFGAEVDNDIVFGANATGTVVFDHSTPTAPSGNAPFFGSISGFGVGDTIDLRDLTFSQGNMTVDPSSGFGPLDASLVVNNGSTTSASLYMLGAYTAGQFHFSSDGHNGTAITLTAQV